MKIRIRKLMSFLFLFAAFSSSMSQTLNLQLIPKDKNQLGLSFEKSFYANDADYSLLSGVYQLHTTIPVSSSLNIAGSIPFININYEYNYRFGSIEYSESGLGNLFVGLQTNSNAADKKRSILTFGIFLPTADEEASFAGVLPNYYDIQKYFPNSFGLYFNYAMQHLYDSGFNFLFEVGPNVIIPTEGDNRETELFIHYGLNLGYRIEQIMLNAEFLGIGIVTEDLDDFGDRLIHQINFGAQWRGEIISPRIYYRLLLKEELSEMIDGILGLGISIALD